MCACQSPPPERAFYHWQTEWQLSTSELAYLDTLNVHKVYLKFFDVDWEATRQQAIPKAALIGNVQQYSGLTIVPTVFITNRTLANLDLPATNELALKISEKVQAIADDYAFTEWQIDCDWTVSTRENYFFLLRTLKTQLPNHQLSTTLRLHQAKFPKQTGVPPVDRVMLMYYNMGDIENWNSDNSIYNAPTAAQYVSSIKNYKLPMDVVLPLFQWGIIYRDGQLFKIIPDLEESVLLDTKRFQQLEEGRYKVTNSTYLEGHYLYTGDQIRLEKIEEADVLEMQNQLQTYLPKQHRTVAFYHLEENIVKRWNADILERIWAK
jgi:hypothetical protein